MRKYLVLGWMLGSLLFLNTLKGQDPIFSQYYLAPLQINPAFAGTTLAPKFSINYRNQWPSFNNAYETYSFSYDQFFEYLNSGFGLYILSDDAGHGIYKTTKLSGHYSYRARLNSVLNLKLGVEAGLVQTRLDWSKLVFGDQIDPISGFLTPGGTPIPSEENIPESTSKTYVDIGTGIIVYGTKFYAGVSLKHINTPDQTILGINDNVNQGLAMRMSIHAGTEIEVFSNNKQSRYTFISPNAMLVKQGEFIQAVGGAYFGYDKFFLGGWYRHTLKNGDALIGSLGVQTGIIKVGYSYDYTISGLGIRTGGSHEIGILINLDYSGLFPKESKYNDCFSLFR